MGEVRRTVKIMADYECYPVWAETDTGADNISPEHLPLSAELAFELTAWASEFDRTLNRDDPSASGFADETHSDSFAIRGLALSQRCADELGGEYRVLYRDHRDGRVLEMS